MPEILALGSKGKSEIEISMKYIRPYLKKKKD